MVGLKQEPQEAIVRCPFCGMSFRPEHIEPVYEKDRLCLVCGYTWTSRGKKSPHRCPSCRSTEWNVRTRKQVECGRCGHRWVPRSSGPPSICPKCKSPRWNESESEPEPIPEEDIRRALSMYSEGVGCIDASLATGVPLEIIVHRISSINDGPVRMSSKPSNG